MLRRWIENWELSTYEDDLDDRRPQAFGWGMEDLGNLVPEHLVHLDPADVLVELGRILSGDGETFYLSRCPRA